MAIGLNGLILAAAALLSAFYINGVPLFVHSRRDPRYAPRSGFGLIQVEGFSQKPGPDGVDLIFVHGLGSNPDTTWRAKKGSSPWVEASENAEDYVYWVQDFLPEDIPFAIRQDMRVFHYNYDSYVYREAPQTSLTGLGNNLMHHIADMLGETQNQAQNRTLVFVGSSYGGLVVKQALLRASTLSKFRHIASRTTGVVFLGTPHKGSKMASRGCVWARALQAHGSNIQMLDEIILDSPRLEDLHDQFVSVFHDSLTVVNIYETRRAVWKKWGFQWGEMIVLPRSATYEGPPDRVINRPFDLDHFQLNKFPARTNEYSILLKQLLKIFQPSAQDVFSVPVGLVPTFTSRRQLLAEIDMAFTEASQDNGSLQTVVLHGLGGAGKSQLARRIVEDRRKEYRTIFWIDASSTVSIRSSFARFATHVGLQILQIGDDRDGDSSLSESAVVQSVLRWIAQRHGLGRRWMIVLDGAEDLTKPEIEAILPQVNNGTLIITSRNPHTCGRYIAANGCSAVLVGSMESDESSGILLRHLQLDRKTADREIRNLSATVGDVLGNLALAVDLAGAYIAEQFFDDAIDALTIYLSDFQRHRDYLLKRKPFLELSSYELTVWTVWDRSLDTIKSKHPDVSAGLLLTFLSAFDGANVQDELFHMAGESFTQVSPPTDAGYDEAPTWLKSWIESDDMTRNSIHLREAQGLLIRYSLVQRVDGPWPGVKIHNLVQWRARQVENDEFWADWSTIFVLAVAHYMVRNTVEPQLRASLLAHISAIDKTFNGVLDRVGRRADTWTAFFFETLARFMLGEGKWAAARATFEQAMLIRWAQQGPEHSDTMRALSQLGSASLQQGHWQEAALLEERALQTQLRDLGENHEETLVSASELASAYDHLGRTAESVELRVRVLRVRAASLGEEHSATVASMNALACTYLALGKAKAAEKLLVKAVEISRRTGRFDHVNTLTQMANLAVAYSQQKRWAEAQALLEEIVERQKKALGETHHVTLKSISNLAFLHQDQQHLEEAESLFRYLLVTRTAIHGEDHPDTLDSAANLASILYTRGRPDEAMTWMDECAILARKGLGADHPYTVKFEEQVRRWRHPPTYWEDFVRGLKMVPTVLWQMITFPILQFWRLVMYLTGSSEDEDGEVWQTFKGLYPMIEA